MHRRSFAWAAYAVGLLVLFGAPRMGVAPIHETGAVEIESAISGVPDPDWLEVSNIESRAAIEPATPVLVEAATEPPAAPDSAAATPAQPEQAAASPAEAAPVARVAVVAPAPLPAATCPVNQFCYPRVGIAGPIVPYGDCTGSTDVGTAIRSLTCLSPTYLVAHAYTQFGRIAGWRAGDIVFAHGVRYVLFDAFTQPGCVVAARPIAPLSLQTSLTSANCGPILVVQGRRE
jgi:hypothetical protein